MTKILFIGNGEGRMPSEGPFSDALHALGDYTYIRDGNYMTESERAEMIRGCDILLVHWDALPVPAQIASDPGRLKYICGITGTMRQFVSLAIIDSGITVSNWGDAAAQQVAEGAVTLLLAVMKDLHAQVDSVAANGWALDTGYVGGSLEDLRVGIYGLGVIGEKFVRMINGMDPVIRIYDPYLHTLPENCLRVESLRELFENSDAVVIHAGLSEETRKSVNAELLAILPDNGIIINTARGDIIDQDALFAELESGRLRAGLDVLASPDNLPKNAAARHWKNCIFTSHSIWKNTWTSANAFSKMEGICLENIKRFINGEPVKNIMTRERYKKST